MSQSGHFGGVVAGCHHPSLARAKIGLDNRVAAGGTGPPAHMTNGTGRRLAKAIHSMIRVLDEDRSVAFYREAFGLDVADRLDFETFTLIYLRNGGSEFEVELTVNKGREEPYALGDGYGHLAFSVSDLDSEHTRFMKAGFKPRDIVEFKPDGNLLARFFFVQDPDGYKIEVLQRHGRYV